MTGNVIPSRRPESWAEFFALDDTTEVPAALMDADDRGQLPHDRDPFEGIGDANIASHVIKGA